MTKKIYVELDQSKLAGIRENLIEFYNEIEDDEDNTKNFLDDCILQLSTPRNPELMMAQATILQAMVASSNRFKEVYIEQICKVFNGYVVQGKYGSGKIVTIHSMDEWRQMLKYPSGEEERIE